MKKLFTLLLCLAGMGMQAQTFKGTITNDTIRELVITCEESGFRQVIAIDKEGHFSAKLNAQPGIYLLNYGSMKPYLLVSDKTNLTLKADGKAFYNTRKFEGEGSAENKLAMEMVVDGTEVYGRLMAPMWFNEDKELKKAKSLMTSWNNQIKTGFPKETQQLLRFVEAEQTKRLNEYIDIIEKRIGLKIIPPPRSALKT